MGRNTNNSDILIADADTAITYLFNQDGTNTATTKYFNLNDPARALSVRVDKTVQIEEINNEVLDDPITVTTNGFNDSIGAWHRHKYIQMKIRIVSATTNVAVFARI